MSGVVGSGAVSSGRFCFLYISQKLKLSDPPSENQPLLPKPGEKTDSVHQAPSAQRREPSSAALRSSFSFKRSSRWHVCATGPVTCAIPWETEHHCFDSLVAVLFHF